MRSFLFTEWSTTDSIIMTMLISMSKSHHRRLKV
uniref:Uncharacterized protein n=1 Tax=Arundo donax TaxID=35708 RepID=A0A0A9H7E0_ARUDO